jgi:hypothetical protein
MRYAPVPPIGTILPNASIVIHATQTGVDEGVVLAYQYFSTQTWVTWRFPLNDRAATWAGHYFASLTDAVDDYTARGGDTTKAARPDTGERRSGEPS